ncbi:MAG: metallophosphoesterase [Thiolinea sp.]
MENVRSAAVRLIQISDLHCYPDDSMPLEWSDIPLYPNRSLSRVLNHLKKKPEAFDALVISGDLVQQEIAESYQRVAQILQGFPWPVYVLPGNHDIPELMQTYLVEPDENIHFQLSQQFKEWQCLFLDTNAPGCPDGHIDARQFTEIALQLDTVDKHTLVFMHHHPLPIGSPWMDKMGLQQTEQFWEIIEAHPQVSCIVFGHIHSEFAVEHKVNEARTVDVFGTPATCVQVLHIDEDLNFDHARPAWRELNLFSDGSVETAVHYLPDE